MDNELIENPVEQLLDQPIIYKIDKGSQAAFDVNDTQDFAFSCCFDDKNLSTQASIPYVSNSLNSHFKPKLIDKSSGVDTRNNLSCLYYETFHGFQCVKNENSLKDLTGTTFKIFNILLKFMPNNNRSLITKENCLLLFLMKIKLGITYSALAVFLVYTEPL